MDELIIKFSLSIALPTDTKATLLQSFYHIINFIDKVIYLSFGICDLIS